MLELICLTHKVVYIPVGFDNANGALSFDVWAVSGHVRIFYSSWE